MPFKIGVAPLRRTRYYLQQGTIRFRDCVKVFAVAYTQYPTAKSHQGVVDFVFWHWSQLQHNNPNVQLVRHHNLFPTALGRAFLADGREVMFDLEDKTREEIEVLLRTTLGRTKIVAQRERFERMLRNNQVLFGKNAKRECICAVQGQFPCTSVLQAPDYLKGKWRWNHNLI